MFIKSQEVSNQWIHAFRSNPFFTVVDRAKKCPDNFIGLIFKIDFIRVNIVMFQIYI